MSSRLTERLFHLSEHNTTIKTEVLAGMTTFMSMAYIFVVNPAMLAETGMPADAAFAATVWASVLPTLFMAFAANLPIALAPGMGVNAFFTYTLVLDMGLPWQSALGAVFLSGLLFFSLAFTPVPRWIMNSVPQNLKLAIGAGIGLFIALIGFQGAGLVVADPDTLLTLGDMTSLPTALACLGLLLSAALMAFRVHGSILLGILAITALGIGLGGTPAPKHISDIISLDVPSVRATLFSLELLPVLKVSFLSVLFTMTMVDMFNAMGTVIGVSRKADMIETAPDGTEQVRGLKRAMIADSGGTLLGGLLGSSPVTSYLESITGIAEGGRTGLTALTAALLFLICLLFAPVVHMVPGFATAPALILVGALMMQDIRHIDFSDITDALPAFLTVVSMPLTYSIVTGFGLGFISYTVLKTCTGRMREVSVVMWVVSACFALNFILV